MSPRSQGFYEDDIIELVQEFDPTTTKTQVLAASRVKEMISTLLHLANILGRAATRGRAEDLLTFLACCGDHNSTFNACAAELAFWLEDKINNFEHFIGELERWASTGNLNKGRCRIILNECRGYLHEYRNKKILFSYYDANVSELESLFDADLQSKLFWQKTFIESGFLSKDPHPALHEYFLLLDHVSELCFVLTSLAVRSLHEAGTIQWTDPPSDSAPQLVDRYNSSIADLGVLTFHPIPRDDLGDNPRLLNVFRVSYADIFTFFRTRIHAPLYAGPQQHFLVYSLPKTENEKRQRLERQGYRELQGKFVLFADLKDSKLASNAEMIEARIADHIASCRHHNIPCQDVGGDAFVFCLSDLYGVKSQIQELRTLIGPLKDPGGGGAPKMSLNFGDVFYHSEYCAFIDKENTIAKANYALEAYEQLRNTYPDPSAILFVLHEATEKLDAGWKDKLSTNMTIQVKGVALQLRYLEVE